jgi:hypothetical protein
MEKYVVSLTEEERNELLTLIKKGKSSASLIMHARVILALDKNTNAEIKKTHAEIAQELLISVTTIERIRKNFVLYGMETIITRKAHPNPKKRILDGEQEAKLIAISCSSPPEGRHHWTLRMLSNKMIELDINVSYTTVGRVLKKTLYNPTRKKNGAYLQSKTENSSAIWKMS